MSPWLFGRGIYFYCMFTITIQAVQDRVTYFVTHQPIDKVSESFTVIRRPDERYVFISNRPLFRNKRIRHRRPDYRLKEGSSYSSQIEMMSEKIDAWVKANLDK